MPRIFVRMFAPDYTVLDTAHVDMDQDTLNNPVALAAAARIAGEKLQRPSGLLDVYVFLSEGRPPTSEEARIQRQARGPDSVWFS